MLTLVVSLVLAILVAGLGLGLALSLVLTRRREPDLTRSPAKYGLAFEDVEFRARDDLTLRGWWIPAPGSQRAVIFLHGYGGSMDPDVQYAPAFHTAGFNVLMFDFRAHGRSEGRLTTIGYLERQDALGAVDWVRSRGIDRVGLLGFSMGGVVALLAAPLCPEVRAVVSDSGPARLASAMTGWGVEHGAPRRFAAGLARLALLGACLRLRCNLFQYEPVRWVGKIAPRPVFLIYGGRDIFVPAADVDRLVAAAREPKEIWRMPKAGHREIDIQAPEEYRRRLVAFFNQHL